MQNPNCKLHKWVYCVTFVVNVFILLASHAVTNKMEFLCLSLARFVTPDELDSLVAYLKDKRARLLRSTGDPLASKRDLVYGGLKNTNNPVSASPNK